MAPVLFPLPDLIRITKVTRLIISNNLSVLGPLCLARLCFCAKKVFPQGCIIYVFLMHWAVVKAYVQDVSYSHYVGDDTQDPLESLLNVMTLIIKL